MNKMKQSQLKNRAGKKVTTQQGYEVEVTEYFGALNCTIQFNDSNKTTLYNQQFSNVCKGTTGNPYHPSLLGVGYIGEGKYKSGCNSKNTPQYEVWRGMLRRCYDKNSREKYPTYKDVTVCEEWKNFQIFAEWFDNNYIENYQLDKDILGKANKIYSPKTCCFVPQEINKLFVRSEKTRGECPIGVNKTKRGKSFESRLNINGKSKHLGTFDTPELAFQAYKTTKEVYIKEVADKWRGQITEQTYNALIDYKVEITD